MRNPDKFEGAMRIFAEESGHQVRLRLPCYMQNSVHLASHAHGFIPLWKYTVNLYISAWHRAPSHHHKKWKHLYSLTSGALSRAFKRWYANTQGLPWCISCAMGRLWRMHGDVAKTPTCTCMVLTHYLYSVDSHLYSCIVSWDEAVSAA